MYILYLFFFQPTYNLFNLILYFLPAHTFWIAIFIIVVFVKILLIPLAIKQSKDNVIFHTLLTRFPLLGDILLVEKIPQQRHND